MARAVNVLGMHRSGTSLTARVLNLLGVDLGSESGIAAPGKRENPKGFWERTAIKELNEEILETLGGSWSEPPELEPGWEHDPALDELRERAGQILAGEFSEAALYGWKDPRSSILLPLYKQVVPDLTYVVCLRHPEGVARSLMHRGNEIERADAHELWLRYTTEALVNTRGSRRQLLFYEDYFEDLDRQVDALVAFLDLDADGLEPAVRAKIRSLADPALFRNRTGPDDDGRLPPEVRALWVALRAGSSESGQSDGAPFAQADTEASTRALLRSLGVRRNGDANLRSELADLRRRRDRAEALSEELAGARAQLADKEARLRSGEAMRDALEVKLTGTEGKLAGTEGKLYGVEERLRITLEDLRASTDAQETTLRELAEAKSELDAARTATQEELRAAGERVRKVERELAAAGSSLAAAEAVEAELRNALQSVERSASWRLTKPIRAVKRVVSRPRAKRRARKAAAPATKDDSAPGTADPARAEASPRHAAPGPGGVHPLEALAQAPPVSVVVPVFNAAQELRACVEAVLRNTTLRGARLILIDDASTEPEVSALLAELGGRRAVQILRNEQNLGFTATVNRGIRESAGCDVVLLNSDTEPGPRWLENLRMAAYSGERIGTATAISDNAGAFAVPEIGKVNPTPSGLAMDDVSRLVAQSSEGRLPETPTGNGFCLYMRRAMIDEVGSFDEVAFPRGYGEENEYSMRAAASGWGHVVDDRTFVHHRREASFGAEKAELSRVGRDAVDRLFPTYTQAVRRFVASPEMARVRSTVARAFETVDEAPRPRVLFVVHQGGGGAPATNADLMAGLAERFDAFALTSDMETLRLWRPAESPEPIAVWPLRRRWSPAEFTRPDFRDVAWEILTGYGIELVHVRHLFKHSLDVPRVARMLGIPIVTSFHDFYLACPTVHLLDEAEVHCGGVCTPGEGTCRFPSPDLASVPPLKHRWIGTWREQMGEVIARSDALVTTSASARQIYERSYPEQELSIEVIEHGRDHGRDAGWKPSPPPPEGKVRILVPGNLDIHKGSRLFARMEEIDRDQGGRLEFHVLGRVDGPLSPGIAHGRYEREEFSRRAAEIDPSLAAILSICPETYCHTLTETWEAGIPVVATDIGALSERIRAHGGGWLVPPDDAEAIYSRLVQIAAEPAEWERKRRELEAIKPRTVADMASDYDRLYRRVLGDRRSLRGTRGRDGESRQARVALFAPGRPGAQPGSTHVRVLRRLTHAGAVERVSFSQPDVSELVAGLLGADVILVQRTGVEPAQAEAVIAHASDSGTPLVVELDDDLLARKHDAGYAEHLPSIARLLAAADHVVASTQHLAMVLSEHTSAPVAIVPNALDERIWFDPLDAGASEPTGGARECLRLLYMGTATHAADLAILRPAIEELRRRKVEVELEVIGGELPGRGQGWYRRIEVPDPVKVYPRFAGWLKAQAGRWDIGVAPLEDMAFNRSKSDLKLLEYSALGLPSIASDVEAFRGWAGDGPAHLVANEPVLWADAIQKLAAAADARSGLARAARRYVRSERCLDSVEIDPLASLLGRAASSDEGAATPGRSHTGAGK